MSDRPTARAAVLAAGAVVVFLLLDNGTSPFAHVPLLVRGVYLVAGGSGLLFVAQRAQGWELLNSPTGYAALLLLLYAAGELVVVSVRPR